MAIYDGTIKVAGGVNPMITLTKAQYDALTPEQKLGNIYMTTDEVEANAVATANTNGLMSSTDKAKLDGILGLVYPVGAIYMSVVNTSPATLFGGTWSVWGTGRVPVGVDTEQTEFNTVEKNGGHKLLQSHNHTFKLHIQNGATHSDGAKYSIPYYTNTGTNYDKTAQDNSQIPWGNYPTGGGNAENLQPYVTCYMWKRTA